MILSDIIRWKGCFMKPIVIKELVDAQIPYNIGMSETNSAFFFRYDALKMYISLRKDH